MINWGGIQNSVECFESSSIQVGSGVNRGDFEPSGWTFLAQECPDGPRKFQYACVQACVNIVLVVQLAVSS